MEKNKQPTAQTRAAASWVLDAAPDSDASLPLNLEALKSSRQTGSAEVILGRGAHMTKMRRKARRPQSALCDDVSEAGVALINNNSY